MQKVKNNMNNEIKSIETSITEKYKRLSGVRDMCSLEAQSYLYDCFVNQNYLAEDKVIKSFLNSYEKGLLMNSSGKKNRPSKCAIALEEEFPRFVLHLLSNVLVPKMYIENSPIAPGDPLDIVEKGESKFEDSLFINEAHITVATHHSILRDSIGFFEHILGKRFNKGVFKQSILSEYVTEVLQLLCEEKHCFYMENISSYRKKPKKKVKKKDKNLKEKKVYKDIHPRNAFKKEVLDRIILKALKVKNLTLIPSRALGSEEEFEILLGKEPVLIIKKRFTNILRIKFFKLNNLPDLTAHRFLPKLFFNPKYSIKQGVLCTSKDPFLSKITSKMVKNVKYLESIAFKINLSKLNVFKSMYMKLIITACGNYDIRNYTGRTHFLNEHFFDGHCKAKNKWTEENYHEFAYLNSTYSKFIAYTLAFNEVIGIGYIYENKDIFFRVILDSRFRFYYKAWPLSPQSQESIFNLLDFSGYTNIIKLDARASGIQILASILKSHSLLKESGCLEEWSSNDIYVFILEEIRKNSLYSYLNRKLIKYTTMKFCYTQGIVSRIRDLQEHCLALNIEIPSDSLISLRERNKNLGKSFGPLVERILPSMCYLLNTLEEELYVLSSDGIRTAKVGPSTYKLVEHEFGTVVQSKLLRLKKLSKEDKKKLKRVRVSYFNCFENKKRELVSYGGNNLVDHPGMARALIPNTIQALDALLMHQMVERARKLSVPIMGRHDCFIIPEQFEEWVQNTYRSIFTRLLKSNFLLSFIEDNFPVIYPEVEVYTKRNLKELRFKKPLISRRLLDRE